VSHYVYIVENELRQILTVRVAEDTSVDTTAQVLADALKCCKGPPDIVVTDGMNSYTRAVRRVLRATPDELRLVVEVPDSVRTRAIDEVVSNTFSDADLVAQRQRARPTNAGGAENRSDGPLTDRQREVVRTAYHSGFFDDDRDVTGRDVASVLDVSHTAFYNHVRRAQRSLFGALFDADRERQEVS